MMRGVLRTLVALGFLGPGPALADDVVPTGAVRSRVVVREGPGAGSRDVGGLRPGERAEYLGAAPGWRRVRLEDGTTGFVSEAFTQVRAQAEGGAPPPAVSQEASVWERMGSALGLAPERRSRAEI